tara:strand:+ start:761 stop:955 length:195 start_codon:yes stop_codon:yes gene_type:complete
MQIGDLIDDGLDNIGIVLKKLYEDDTEIYWCHFPNGDGIDGWYDCYDIKVLGIYRANILREVLG